MAGETQTVWWKFVVDPSQALGAMNRVAGAAGGVSKAFDRASGAVGALTAVGGGLAAAFSLHGIITSTMEQFRAIKRISEATKLSTREATGWKEALESAGIEGTEAEGILLRMSRAGAKMDEAMAGVQGNTGQLRQRMARLGVDINKGPAASIIQMSKAVKAGKLNAEELMLTFGMRQQQALDFMELLRQGPESIKATVEEAKKFGVTPEQMAGFTKMVKAQHKIETAWRTIQRIIGTEILPIAADLVSGVADKMKDWVGTARKFGQILHDHLAGGITMAIRLGKILLLNATLMKVSQIGGGQGFGLGGAVGRAGRFVGLGRLASSPIGLGMLRPLISVLGRLGLIGSVIMIAVKAFEAIKDNANGVRDRLGKFFAKMQGHFAVIGKLFAPVIHAFSGEGSIGRFFTTVVVVAIDTLAQMVDNIMLVIETVIIFVKKIVNEPRRLLGDTISTMGEAVIEANGMVQKAAKEQADREAARRKAEASRPDAPGERAGTNFNFPGARFTIEQSFAEGFDPDRVAVALTNDIASMAERRLQSGFSPAFAVR